MAFLVTVTTHGVMRKVDAGEFRTQGRGGAGVQGINLGEGESVAGAVVIEHDRDLLVFTHKGVTIRISSAELRPMHRTSLGVKGMSVKEGDKVVGLVAV